MENEKFIPASFNWDIRIFRNVDSNHWKYWIFNIEIFTYFDKNIILERTYGWR